MTTLRVGAGLLLSVCLATAQFGWFHRNRPSHKKEQPGEERVLGVVMKKTADSFVVRAVDTRVITFKISDSTLYFRSWKWASPSNLKSGAVVKVAADADPDGILT